SRARATPVGFASPAEGSRNFQRRDCSDLLGHTIFCNLQFELGLQIEPELWLHTEVPPQTKGCIRGNPPLTVNDLVDPTRWHSDRHCELVLRDAEPLKEVLHQNLSRVGRWIKLFGHVSSSVVVDGLNAF